MPGFFVEQLKVTGKGKRDSIIVFTRGLNVIHGKSDSGKTIAGNCIEYAMGGSTLPFSSEITGYESVSVSFRTYDGFSIEVTRRLGDEIVTVKSDEPEIKSGIYKIDSKNDDETLNAILLYLIGLDFVPKVAKNSSSDKVRLTWKNLMRALYLDKESMSKSSDVLVPKSSYEKTTFLSVLLYIVYGQDFSEKDPQTKAAIRKAQFDAKMELIKQKKADLEKKKADTDEKLKATISNDSIQESFAKYTEFLGRIEKEIDSSIEKSKEYYHSIVDENQRLRNNQVLKERYDNLRSQYLADINRLNNIADGEQFLSKYPDSSRCPLCGVGDIPDHLLIPHLDAAKAELKKTINLLSDLENAEREINEQIDASTKEIARFEKERRLCNSNVENQLKPAAESLRKILANCEESIMLNQRIAFYNEMLGDFEKDKELIELENKQEKTASKKNQYKPKEFFQQDLVDSLTGYAQKILKFCNYNKAQDTTFSLDSFDLQVHGVDKALIHGQGYCSMFNSILYLVFRECFFDKATYKPGFLMIDTPLLGLVERVGEQASLNYETRIYKYLVNHINEGQVIILDNAVKLPEFLYQNTNVSVIEFSPDGRKGFLIDYESED